MKYFQKNYKTTEDPPRLDVCIIFCPSVTIFRFHIGLSRTSNAVCASTACAPDPSHTEKVLRFCTKSHDSHDFVPKFAEKNTHFFRPLPGGMQINTYLISKGPISVALHVGCSEGFYRPIDVSSSRILSEL